MRQASCWSAARFGFKIWYWRWLLFSGCLRRWPSSVHVEAKGSREDECLQACDYFMWALQRHFERDESGFIEMLWSKVGEVVDLDLEHDGRRGKIYGPKKPIAKGSA